MSRVVLIGITVFIINFFFYQMCFVDGESMYPTLKDKQIVFMKKYNLKLQHNNILVIKKGKRIIIKRLIGMPGDAIKIDNYVYVNGEKSDEILTIEKGRVEQEITLKDDEYFVLGDNRANSIDSRFDEIGIIHKNEIVGKIINVKK